MLLTHSLFCLSCWLAYFLVNFMHTKCRWSKITAHQIVFLIDIGLKINIYLTCIFIFYASFVCALNHITHRFLVNKSKTQNLQFFGFENREKSHFANYCVWFNRCYKTCNVEPLAHVRSIIQCCLKVILIA